MSHPRPKTSQTLFIPTGEPGVKPDGYHDNDYVDAVATDWDGFWNPIDPDEPLGIVNSPLVSPENLGYKGRFSLRRPGHVILESLDEHKFSIPKTVLGHSSGFFRSMFDLPVPTDGQPVTVPTFVLADDLYLLLVIIDDQSEFYGPDITKLVHLGVEIKIPTAIHKLSLVEKVTLQELADRFDCETIGASVKHCLDIYYSSLTALNLLAVASKVESITVARVAITKIADDCEFRSRSRMDAWWTLIEDIRPSWQVELTKLIWEFQQELVNAHLERGRRPNGKRLPRSRETIMVQTTRSREAIAAASILRKTRDDTLELESLK